MKVELYDQTKQLESQIEKVREDSKLSERNKELLLKFQRQNQTGKLRQVKLLKSIRLIGYYLNKDFDKVTKEDIESYVNYLTNSNYAEWTKYDYKTILKIFYRWLGKTDVVSWVKCRNGNGKHTAMLPEELLTQEEIKKLIQAARTKRNRLLVSLLYESGARIGEIRNLKLKNISFDEYGCKVTLSGKTGMRRILLRECVPFLKEYINEHPRADEPESYLFTKSNGEFMCYQSIRKILRQIFQRAGIKKRANPHSFRHQRATYLANFLTEAQMKVYFGWEQSSDMASIYVHMSGRDCDEALLSKVYGLAKLRKEAQESKLKPKECPRCKELNAVTNKYCSICNCPLDAEEQDRIQKLKQVVGNIICDLMNENKAINETNAKQKIRELMPQITQQI